MVQDTGRPAAAVPMVLFTAGEYRFALEAHFVASMAEAPSTPRFIAASTLLLDLPARSLPAHWLTLHDAKGPWQLGVGQPVTLRALPARKLNPLPPLIKARCFHPALCGAAFEQQALLLLLDARLLSPQATSS